MEYLTWVVAIISVTSAILNIYKHWLGFAGWVVTNTAWVAVCIWQGNYAQAAMFTVYLGLAIWGLLAWRRTAREAAEDKADLEVIRQRWNEPSISLAELKKELACWFETPDDIGA